ncbi:hypothetical protein DIPPA_04964 [Diplonema papillatum]|nr:hypothetical protein DIPPA_04964 [Diplonema papillatum]
MVAPVNVKLLLAEAFDLAKRAAAEEGRADAMQEGWRKSSDRDASKLKAAYKRSYTTWVECLERFNRVRLNAPDPSMGRFCAEKMERYMAACEGVKQKETNLLLPASQATPHKDGYVLGDVLFERRPDNKMKPKEDIYHEVIVGPGSYQVCVKYLDQTSVASSTVLAQVALETSKDQTKKYMKHLPSYTQWSRVIGVAMADAPAKLRVKVTSDSWIRALKVHVLIQALVEAPRSGRSVVLPLPPYAIPPSSSSMHSLPTEGFSPSAPYESPTDDAAANDAYAAECPEASGPPEDWDPLAALQIPRGEIGGPAGGGDSPGPGNAREVTMEELEALRIPPRENWDTPPTRTQAKPAGLPPPPASIGVFLGEGGADAAAPAGMPAPSGPPAADEPAAVAASPEVSAHRPAVDRSAEIRADLLEALVRASSQSGGCGAPVPMHSASPGSMTELSRIAGSAAAWNDATPEDTQQSDLATFLSALPRPHPLDPV